MPTVNDAVMDTQRGAGHIVRAVAAGHSAITAPAGLSAFAGPRLRRIALTDGPSIEITAVRRAADHREPVLDLIDLLARRVSPMAETANSILPKPASP